MKHFTSKEWVDFARGTMSKDQRTLMQRHLETGCKKCRSEAGLWRHVQETAVRVTAAGPAERGVREVKGMFAIAGHKHRSVRTPIVQLLFDSFLEPLPAGIRSAAPSPRQLLFGAGSLRVDLRLEPLTDSDHVALIGQILDSNEMSAIPEQVSVALFKAGKPVAETQTNRFGEFQFECDLAGQLELRLRLPRLEDISILLVEPSSSPRAKQQRAGFTAVAEEFGTRKGTRRKN